MWEADDSQAHAMLAGEARLAILSYLRANSSAVLWLTIFCVSGIAVAMSFVLLHVHAGPAKDQSLFLLFLGYWAQCLAGLFWLIIRRSWHIGVWSRKMVAVLLLSAVMSSVSESLAYVGKLHGGISLFSIIHSSVAIFACASATVVLKIRVAWVQWLGAVLVVGGLLVTVLPPALHSSAVQSSLFLGVLFLVMSSIGNAASYPVAELIFRMTPSPPSEEMACFCGSLVNVLVLSGWTAGYTVPRWHETVEMPIEHASHPSVQWAWAAYALYTGTLGVHSLAFWKSLSKVGTVPVAISIGAQQAGVFIFAHLLFCKTEPEMCFINDESGTDMWHKSQKVVAFTLCCVGCLIAAQGSSASPQNHLHSHSHLHPHPTSIPIPTSTPIPTCSPIPIPTCSPSPIPITTCSPMPIPTSIPIPISIQTPVPTGIPIPTPTALTSNGLKLSDIDPS
eukprot:CAMPEP_0119322494 /NCGR_PEP_ID=MMETSP1333-20130426/58369_1 /TAXON_ID=418940 /ORGANISM="Scyphosphaera apsteinii, Strain RCC1455" /LENGTH=448 /DNA_ID=CAMNT_0007329743 /DNA_START=13 /DNA_END=1359 /DNA_ORIENTATION=+